VSSFDPQRRKLSDLLDDLETGVLQLPEFQRPYKWNARQKKHLLTSIQKNYPIGTLLFLELGPNSAGRKFRALPIEPVALGGAKVDIPSDLILDGQQRLTSLFLSFRKRASKEWVCLDVQSLFESSKKQGIDEIELEEHIKFHKFEASPENVIINKHLLPLYLAMPDAEERTLTQILSQYARTLEDAGSTELAAFVGRQLDELMRVFANYELPVVRLSKDLGLSAITSIFTELNNTGLKLTSFDLCVARFFPDNVNIKKLHDDSVAKSANGYSWLAGDGTVTLQTIALGRSKPDAPVSSKKTKLVDSLDSAWVKRDWKTASEALEELAQSFQATGFTRKTLPYDAVVPALALARQRAVEKGASLAKVNQKLRVFLLATGFNKRYTEGTDSKRDTDLPEFFRFATEDVRPPSLEEIFNVQEMLSQGLAGARYKSFQALLNSQAPLDPHTGEELGLDVPSKTSAQMHHMFPESYLSKMSPKLVAARKPWNVALNMVFLSGPTNNMLGELPPSAQLQMLIAKKANDLGNTKAAAEKSVKATLAVQLVDDEGWAALQADDFDAFVVARARNLERKLDEIGLRVDYLSGETTEVEDEEED